MDIDYTPALLHREFNDNEIFVSHQQDGYFISGICDFENALCGHYELDWVEINKAFGTTRNLIAHFLRGYKSTDLDKIKVGERMRTLNMVEVYELA